MSTGDTQYSTLVGGAEITQRDLLSTFSNGALIDGKHRIEVLLGAGSMGTVFKAFDQSLERKVAIKVLSGAAGNTEEGQRLFKQEAIAMALIRHPNVVQVFSAGHEGRYPYLVMEYVEGTSLERYLQRIQRLHVDVALGLLKQTAVGLDAIHSAGLVHRDVKPGNILIDNEYNAQLIDFGLVDLAKGAWADTVSGTPGYMAPEHIRVKELPKEQRHLGDVYALGVVAFELLTGRLPFDSEDPKVTLRKHLNEPPPSASAFVDDLPDNYDAVLARALSKEAAQRWPSATAFVDELQRARDAAVEKLPGSGLSILAVEDDPDQQDLYQIILESAFGEGTLQVAEDGLSAMAQIRANRPDLIILDLNMPRLNGLELVSLLSQKPAWRAIPLVVVSGEADPVNRELLYAFGVREVHLKPVPPKELVELVKRMARTEQKTNGR